MIPCDHLNDGRCVHASVDRKVKQTFCAICPLHTALGGPPPRTACIYRGQIVRTDTCQLCGAADGPKGHPVEVRACSIHGECTAARFKVGKSPRACRTCDDWAPAR